MFAKKIFSKRQILSAMAGVAMLALPVSAFAGNYGNWNHSRPLAARLLHRGWARHQLTPGGAYGAPAQRATINSYAPSAYRPYAWNNGYRQAWVAPASTYQPYGGAYSACVPAGASGSQSPGWLMAKRERTMATIARLRARHDSRGAARLVPVVTALNQRIGGLHNGSCGNAPTSYVPPANYNHGGYSNGSYAGNSSANALSSLALPFLGGVR